MPLSKVQFRAGINKEGTQFSASPSWFDADKIRFRKGRVEQIGGWAKYTETSYKGVARSLFDWGTSGAAIYMGIGTNLKFYVETGLTITDITPIRATTAAGDVTFAAVNGDATLTVTENSHGTVTGDYVTFSGASSLGGNILAAILNQEYEIATITDTNTFTVEAKDTNGDVVLANASDTGNSGASTVGAYQINTGTNAFLPSVGYSLGTYGSGTWGGGGTLTFAGQLRLYSQDSFGDDLIFNPRIGGVYYWDESVGISSRAVNLSALSGASDTPTIAMQVMVSQVDRHIICFGTNTLGSNSSNPLDDLDPLLVRWSDQENAADWTPTAINSAGGQVLSSGSEIVGAVKTRQEILIFTKESIHSMRFSGAPFVFQFAVISEQVSMLSPKAAVNTGDAVFFMDMEGFYRYLGSVERLPCSVLNHVFSNIDTTQLYKVFSSHNPSDSEVTWYYPTGTAPAEINRYVTYNYVENHWSIGTFDRGAWIQAKTKTNPIASSNDISSPKVNYLYNQETGDDADGSDIGGFVESGTMSIGDGESFVFMNRFIPDFRITGTANNASFAVEIKANNFPLNSLTTESTSTVLASTNQSHIRVRAREIAMKITSSGSGYGWTMGDFRFDMKTDGRR